MRNRVHSAAAFAVILAVVSSAPAQARPAAWSATISARLTVPSRTIVTGSVVHAELHILNNTGEDVTVTTCGSPFAVALSTKTYTPLLAWPLCAMQFTIPLGASTYDLPLRASLGSCGGEGTIPGQGPPVPCVNGKPPPLPLGKYRVTLFQNPTVVGAPNSLTVRVVAAQRVNQSDAPDLPHWHADRASWTRGHRPGP